MKSKRYIITQGLVLWYKYIKIKNKYASNSAIKIALEGLSLRELSELEDEYNEYMTIHNYHYTQLKKLFE